MMTGSPTVAPLGSESSQSFEPLLASKTPTVCGFVVPTRYEVSSAHQSFLRLGMMPSDSDTASLPSARAMPISGQQKPRAATSVRQIADHCGPIGADVVLLTRASQGINDAVKHDRTGWIDARTGYAPEFPPVGQGHSNQLIVIRVIAPGFNIFREAEIDDTVCDRRCGVPTRVRPYWTKVP